MFSACQTDDVLVFGKDQAEHNARVMAVLKINVCAVARKSILVPIFLKSASRFQYSNLIGCGYTSLATCQLCPKLSAVKMLCSTEMTRTVKSKRL